MLCNSFTFENNVHVKPHRSLFFDSEPNNNNTQPKLGAHLPTQLENLR